MGIRSVVATAAIAVLALVAGIVVAVTPADEASAANSADFNPAYIISDAKFYDGSSLDQVSVQNFLNWVSPGCQSGYTCLKNYRQDTWSRAADSYCSGYNGEAAEPAARIIVKVAMACGISARVLIVTLQKEQGLVTSTAPSATRYERAMGYGCPDTAPCDAQFFGFYNQVYKAAWQFRVYGASRSFTYFPVGRPSAVRYSPNAACGAGTLTILNKATAALYYYTPYQPNAAAVANLYGSGDGCSSYGNRNFWRYYSDWFGSPTVEHDPAGYIDSATTATGGIRVTGWAADPDAPSTPLWLRITVDGTVVGAVPGALLRSDVSDAYPIYGSFQGFDRVIPASTGTHRVCATALNIYSGRDVDFGCLTATAGAGVVAPQPDLPVGAPRGWLDSVTTAPGGVQVAGWALDPEVASPIAVDVYSDGAYVTRLAADDARSDLASSFPGYGGSHGFRDTVALPPGTHQVCVWAVGYGFGGNLGLGCARTTTGSGAPIGYQDSIAASAGKIQVGGWAIDPARVDSIPVHVYLDGTFRTAVTASGSRPDLATGYPAYGQSHGFSSTVDALPGRHTVCSYALGTGVATALGCSSVVVPSGNPVGWFDSAVAVPGGIAVSGWSIDPDSTGPVDVRLTVDGRVLQTTSAATPRDDVARAYPGYGGSHGFTTTISGLGAGTHSVCATAVNQAAGGDTTLGCIRATVLAGSPFGYIDSAVRGSSGVVVSGWAIDPDTTAAATVVVTVGGQSVAEVSASVDRVDLATAYPGYGASHGARVALPASTQGTVCMTARNVGTGADVSLGCVTVR